MARFFNLRDSVTFAIRLRFRQARFNLKLKLKLTVTPAPLPSRAGHFPSFPSPASRIRKRKMAAATTAAQVFALMAQAVDEVGPTLVPKVKGVIKFDVTGAGLWLVDLKNGSGKVASATAADKADIVITVGVRDFTTGR